MSVVKAVFKRNLAGFFGNPAGYVFIILFVGLTACVAFVDERFFAANQANLNILTFNMPWLLMLFVSAVTMSTWAEEKKLGTDELLFTLPGTDMAVVVGKFLANLAIFTAALIFTLSHVVILCYLGDPDFGLLFATYLGYWLLGAAFIATGMFASSLTNNLTVGFILGALFCAVFAFAQNLALLLPGRFGLGVDAFAAVTHLEGFNRGVVSFEDVVYFLSIVGGMLYLNAIVLGTRRWPGGAVALKKSPLIHVTLRIISVAVILISVNILLSRFGGRTDISAERLSSLSDKTLEVIDELDPSKPVYIQAWISEDVPEGFVETRDSLLGLLREFDVRGGDAVRVKVYRPERYSQEARDARDKFQIIPMSVVTQEEGETASDEIFMGAAFICGVEEEVIPFFHTGTSVEYELTRTIRVVSQGVRPKVGVIDNELKLLGGFDFQTRDRFPAWQIVEELKKQYDVDRLQLGSEVPEDVDVILCALPSLLKDDELDDLMQAIRSGKPTLLLMDPLPLVNLELSPRLPRPNPSANPFMGQQPPSEPKCKLNKLLDFLGIRFSPDNLVWDMENPHPSLKHLPPDFVFISAASDANGGKGGFNNDDVTTSGLQELLAFFPGSLGKASNMEGSLTFEPLLRTSAVTSGMIWWDDVVGQTFFGARIQPFETLKRLPRRPNPQSFILAARVQGELPPEKTETPENETAEGEEGEVKEEETTVEKPDKINVILVSDLDLISNQLFEIRRAKWIDFDNIPFILNCVDSLAGDESYISLRKRRNRSRTLTRIEEIEREFEQIKLQEESEAESEAQMKLAEAQASFDEKVKAVESRDDVDMRTKEIMLAQVQKTEQQRLTAKKDKIDEEKNKKLDASRFAMKEKVRQVKQEKKYMAVVFPIIPPLVIAIILFLLRRSRENRGALESRMMRN